LRGLEFLIAFFLLLGLLMGYTSGIPGGHFVTMIGSGFLALFYYFTGIGISRNSFISRLRNAEPGEKVFIWMRTLAGLTFALSAITILYNEMYWPGALVFRYISIFLLTVLMFLDIYFLEKNDPGMFRFIMARSIIFSTMLVFYVVTPLSKRLEWKYDDQYYREILQYSIEHPEDKQAKKNVRDYERKSRGEVILEGDEE
jgi:hypothetical protein